ncbi:hypothetical protein ACHAXR_004358 [Thalassiosira sp. AJA248-18]
MIRILQPPLRILAGSPSLVAIPRARGFSSCPFQILGLKSKRIDQSIAPSHRTDHTITYKQVHIAFRELALKHHPDTTKNSSRNSSSTDFNRIREAFEAIVEGPSGIAVLRDPYVERRDSGDKNEMDVPDAEETKNSYNAFQDEQNGYLHPSVNPQILREVAEVAEKMNPGGLDKGGMWQYANMIRTMAKEGGEGLPPLRVDGGDDVDRKESESRVRRRRKRR